jgi:hypothetical protein
MQGQVSEVALRFPGMFVAEVAAARPGRTVARPEAFRRLLGDLGN